MESVFHYTNKTGWNGIRALSPWRFRAKQPRDRDRPVGAYFTDLEPNETNLRVLFKRIRVPKAKQKFVFWFVGSEGLKQLNNGTGRDKRILWSPVDYDVEKDRQKHGDVTVALLKEFQ